MASDIQRANKLAQKLKKQENLSSQEIRNGVKEVIQEYQPLITKKESAVIFYARKQHGVQLVETEAPTLDIENIVPDMNQVNLKCRVISVDKFTYTKEGETRQGCDIRLSDDTGEISMMVWGDDVNEIDTSLKGEKVEVSGSYSSEYQGDVQLNYSDGTEISAV